MNSRWRFVVPLSREARLGTIIMLFVATNVASNFLGVFIMPLGRLMVNWGAIAYALCCSLVDVVNEVDGKEAAKRVWGGAIWVYCACLALIGLWLMMPSGAMVPDGATEPLAKYKINETGPAYARAAAGLFLGSMTSFIVSQAIGIEVFDRMKAITGTIVWVRGVVTSLLAQFVDTLIFVVVAFAWPVIRNELSAADLIGMTMGQLLAKLVISYVVLAPAVTVAAAWVRRGVPGKPLPASGS